MQTLIKHELALIAELGYEAYFLTVFDIVRFARRSGILCQGRGSAANSDSSTVLPATTRAGNVVRRGPSREVRQAERLHEDVPEGYRDGFVAQLGAGG